MDSTAPCASNGRERSRSWRTSAGRCGDDRLIQITPQLRILVAVEAIDGRKGIDSLAQLCREKLDADPFSGCLFIFRSRSAKSIRILAYDGQGFWLTVKCLSKGRFRWWPTGREASKTLRAHQAQLLLAAGNPETEAAPVWRRVSPSTLKKNHVWDLRSGFCSATLYNRCQLSGATGAEPLRRKTSYSFASSSLSIPA